MSEIQTTDWDETAASNNQTAPNGWPEGMAPSAVNDAAREMMAAVKRWFNRVTGRADAGTLISSAGTSTAITVTYDTAPASLYTGLECAFKVTTTCGASPTLNVNSLGAKNIQKFRGGYVDLSANDIVATQHVKVKYDGTLDKWVLLERSLQGEEFISVQTASASATIDFVLTGYLSTYRAFKVVLIDVVPATDGANLLFRTSTNAGSSYDAGASDYTHVRTVANETAVSATSGSTGDTSITLATSLSSTASRSLDGEVLVFNPSSGAQQIKMQFDLTYVSSAANLARVVGSGRRATTADVDAIRFLMSSGNITSGSFALYGIR